MTNKVYLNYDQKELDAQYNARAKVPSFDAFVTQWLNRSEQVISSLSCRLDVAYGDSKNDTLDIFYPHGGGPAPVLIFFHGGYWRSGDKSWFRFLAKSFVEHGATFVIPKYTLFPDQNMDKLIDQCRRAVIWTHNNATEYGGDNSRLFLSGHSAGGHISGMMMATDWSSQGNLPNDTIKGLIGISGLYDLEPIRLSHVNKVLRLTKACASRNSPSKKSMSVKPPNTIIAHGMLESEEYRRQANYYIDRLHKAGGNPISFAVEGHHHFSILDAFANPRHRFGSAVLSQLGLA